MNQVDSLERQIKELEVAIRRPRLLEKSQRIIHNTPEAINRLNEVRRLAPWRGREIAMEQEEVNYGNP